MFGLFAGWFTDWLVCRLVGRLVGWPVGRRALSALPHLCLVVAVVVVAGVDVVFGVVAASVGCCPGRGC